jgi:hypothetical protein
VFVVAGERIEPALDADCDAPRHVSVPGRATDHAHRTTARAVNRLTLRHGHRRADVAGIDRCDSSVQKAVVDGRNRTDGGVRGLSVANCRWCGEDA